MLRILFLSLTFLLLFNTAEGQLDPHFSQYLHTPLMVNPAKAGQIDGDMRLIANYRNQWSSVTTPFSTASLSYDTRIPKYFGRSCSYFGAGLVLLNDQAGDANFRTTNAQLALSYHQSLSKRGKPSYMSVGLMVGGGQRSLDLTKLYYDNQFNGDTFDTGLANGENFDRNSFLYLDISAGLNFALAIGKTSGVSFGLGMYHLNQPNVSFLGDDNETLFARFVANIDASLSFGDDSQLTVLPTVVFMNQGRHQEFTAGVMVKYNTSSRFAIGGGVMYRNSDAVIPMIRFDFKPVALAFSYDVNLSDLQVASNNNGSMEISLIFSPQIFSQRQACGAIFCPW